MTVDPSLIVNLQGGVQGVIRQVRDNGGPQRDVIRINVGNGTQPPTQPPTNVITPLLGMSCEDGDVRHYEITGGATGGGLWPEMATTYYQSTSVGTRMLTAERTRLDHGTVLLTGYSMKNLWRTANADGTFTFSDNVGLRAIYTVLTGGTHPDYTRVVANLDLYIAGLKAMADAYPTMPFYCGVEGEVDAKMWKYNHPTQFPNATADMMVAALPHEAGPALAWCYERIHNGTPDNVRTCLWFAGSQTGYMHDTMQAMPSGSGSHTDVVVMDPYTNGAGIESMLKCFRDHLNWMRGDTAYQRIGAPPLAIGECGMGMKDQAGNPTHTDAEIAEYIFPGTPPTDAGSPVTQVANYNARTTLADAKVLFAVWFDHDRDRDHEITDGEHPLSEAAWERSVKAAKVSWGGTTSGGGTGGGGGGTTTGTLTGIGSTLTSIADPDSTGALVQTSGLDGSRKNTTSSHRMFWALNDDPPAEVYCIDDRNDGTNGRKVRHKIALTGVSNVDWEDIAVGPGPDPAKSYIYVAQVGSGAGSAQKRIFRVEEPTVTPGQALVSTSQTPVIFTITMPFTNSEAFAIDPVSGDGFIIEKAGNAVNTVDVLRVPGIVGEESSATITTSVVASINVNTSSTTETGAPTAFDITHDGRYIILASYQRIWVWNRDLTKTIAQTFAAKPAGDVYRFYGPNVLGTESLCFDPGSTPPIRFYSVNEGVGASLKHGALEYTP